MSPRPSITPRGIRASRPLRTRARARRKVVRMAATSRPQAAREDAMATHMVSEGRRLMLPTDRGKPDHDKDLTIACDVVSYSTNDGSRRVAFIRAFHRGPWKFRVVAVDVGTGALLATTLVETWDE